MSNSNSDLDLDDFNFNIDTNKAKRGICFESLKNKLVWLNNVSPSENVIRLSEYKFCICP